MVRYFAGMDYTPAGFVPDFGLIIVFVSDEEVWENFYHELSTLE